MATREEEVQNLQTMQHALQRQDELVKRIEDEERYIKEQYQRRVNDYPAYKAEAFNFSDAYIENVEWKTKPGRTISILYWIAIYLGFICCMLGGLTYGGSGDMGTMVLLAIMGGIVGETVLATIICCSIENENEKLNPPIKSIVLFSIRGALLLVTSFVLSLVKVVEGNNNIAAIYAFVCTGLTLGAIAGHLVLFFKFRKKQKEYKRQIKEERDRKNQARKAYQQEEIARRAEYNKKKAIADVEIAQQREALKAEVAHNVAQRLVRIEGYKAEYQQMQQLLVQSPGLALEDKNAYTIATLLSYFTRGRADSIKEGLNLLISETREEAILEEKRRARKAQEDALWRMETDLKIAQNNWEREQRNAREEMLENQRRHNDRVEEELRKARESLEEDLRQRRGY